jgi:hypothetical protein
MKVEIKVTEDMDKSDELVGEWPHGLEMSAIVEVYGEELDGDAVDVFRMLVDAARRFGLGMEE